MRTRTRPPVLIGARRQVRGGAVYDIEYGPDLVQSAHAHDHATVSLILRGGLREEVARRTEEGGAGTLIIKPAGTRHADRYSASGARLVTVRLPDGAMAAAAEHDCGIGPWRWRRGGSAVPALLRILLLLREGTAQCTQRKPSATDARLDEAFTTLLAALADDRDPAAAGPPPQWLEEAREELEHRRDEADRVRAAARAVGYHPVYLARRFRRHFGCSPTEHLGRLRLTEAAWLVADSERDLAGVAYAAGYADQSHMCRDFDRRLGISPAAFRALCRNRRA